MGEACEDIRDHLPLLTKLAAECDTVVEFGVRGGCSTKALVEGARTGLISYDTNRAVHPPRPYEVAAQRGITFELRYGDSREIPAQQGDLLFIDSTHTYGCLRKELARHGDLFRRYIAMHDTTLYGALGEDGSEPGLRAAIEEWLQDRPEWRVKYDLPNCCGLMVLERCET